MTGKPWLTAGAPWVAVFEGKAYRGRDLTVLAVAKAAKAAGCGWLELDLLSHPDHFAALLAASVHQETGEDFDAVHARIMRLGQLDALDMVAVDGDR